MTRTIMLTTIAIAIIFAIRWRALKKQNRPTRIFTIATLLVSGLLWVMASNAGHIPTIPEMVEHAFSAFTLQSEGM